MTVRIMRFPHPVNGYTHQEMMLPKELTPVLVDPVAIGLQRLADPNSAFIILLLVCNDLLKKSSPRSVGSPP